MTLRLTSSSRAGTSRNEVAVGTSRLASMLVTIRAAAPRRGSTRSAGGSASASVVGRGAAAGAAGAAAADAAGAAGAGAAGPPGAGAAGVDGAAVAADGAAV